MSNNNSSSSSSEDYSTESQKKVYTIWANNILSKRNLHIVDLFEDLKDGVYLINLLEILTNEKSENYISKPKNRLQQLSNVQLALNVIDRWGISLVNCRPEHLVDKHVKMTLSLIWRLISKFQIQQFLTDEDFALDQPILSNNSSTTATSTATTISSSSSSSSSLSVPNSNENTASNELNRQSIATPRLSSNSKPTAKEALLRWCRREIEGYSNTTSITNFSKAFQSPQLFYCLIHKYCPESIDLDTISKLGEVEALSKCFDIAEKQLNIPKFLTPQNIIEGPIDEYCVMTYISYFLNYRRNLTNPSSSSSSSSSTTTTMGFSKGHHRVSSTGSNSSTISDSGITVNSNISSTQNNSSTTTTTTTTTAKKRISLAPIVAPLNPNLLNNNQNNNISTINNPNPTTNTSNNVPTITTPTNKSNSTPEKANFNNNLNTTPTSSPALDRTLQQPSTSSPRPIQKQPSFSQIVQIPQHQQQQQQQDKNSIIEIINNFTKELKRFSEQHESMLIKTSTILDEKVNKLADKLDQLETKISSMKSVITSITEQHNNDNSNHHHHHHHHHHHNNNNNKNIINSSSPNSSSNNSTPNNITSEENSPLATSKKKNPTLSPSSSSSTPAVAPSNKSSKPKESQQEKEERREKRRSRRREKEERRLTREREANSNTLTQSSSSCSLADDAQVDREEVKRIVRCQAIIRGYLIRKRYKRIKNRREVAQEILKTEETYVNSLSVLLQYYLIPLKNESASVSSISADNVKTLTNNIEVILNMNNMLLKRLKERMSTPWHYQQLFGDIFFKMSDLLKCYIAYVNHYNRALSTVNDFSKHPALNEFINSTFMKTHQQLRDLIIIPVQRIPRYVLLLEEMCKVTETTHPDYQQLTGSLTKMQSIADHVNEKRRDFENVIHVSLLQEAIIGFNIMEYSSLRYIMEGDLQAHIMTGGSGFGGAIAGVVGNASSTNGSGHDSSNSKGGVPTNLHVFLFNQMLVVCKYKKGKDSYFANKTLFGSVNNEKHKSKQPKYKYLSHHNLTSQTKLSHNKSENWFGVDNGGEYKRFFTRTVAEKDMWIQNIQPCIDKAQEIKTLKSNANK